MRYYLEYILRCEEPCKMGTQGNQNNTRALSYIAGSSIRGAMISQYLNHYDLEDKQDLFKGTYFYDAYYCDGDRKLVPVPAIYYASKHDVRKAKQENQKTYNIHSCYGHDDEPAEGEQRVDTGTYAYFEGDTYYPYSVKKEGNLHITIAKPDMFRYEAISPEQNFSGVICFTDEETMKRFEAILNDATLYIGGSKGSGYGRSRIKKIHQLSFDELVESYHLPKKEVQKYFSLYALSNVLFVDEHGDLKATISNEYLEKHLGISNVKLEKAYVSTTRTASFNHTWKAGNVQQVAIKAGSYFIYSYEGEWNGAYKALEEQGIGQRKNEGFGRVLFNPDFSQSKRKAFTVSDTKEKVLDISAEDLSFLKHLKEDINESRKEKLIDEAAYRCYEKSKKPLSNSQLARLYNVLDQVLTHPLYVNNIKMSKDKINRFRDELKTDSLKSYQLRELILDNQQHRKYYDMLNELTDDHTTYTMWDLKYQESYEQFSYDRDVELKIKEKVVNKDEEQFRMKCLFLYKVLYNQMRGGSRS